MSDRSSHRIHWLDIPALVLFVVLAAVVLLQFLSRYVLNDSVAWTEEIARYLLIGVAYAGSIGALRKGEHIFLEVIYRRVSAASVKPLAILVDLVSVAFHAVLTLLAANLTLAADRRMISVDLPKSIVYGFVTFTLLAATVVTVRRLIYRARQDGDQILRDIELAAAGEDAPSDAPPPDDSADHSADDAADDAAETPAEAPAETTVEAAAEAPAEPAADETEAPRE